jgi:hypothetical protein
VAICSVTIVRSCWASTLEPQLPKGVEWGDLLRGCHGVSGTECDTKILASLKVTSQFSYRSI